MKPLRQLFTQLTDWIGSRAWPRLIITAKDDEQAPISKRESILVFAVAYVIAVISWLMVNLDREFNLEMELPVSTVSIAPDKALVSPIPASVTVGMSGQGWKLLSVYNNPPVIPLDLDETQVNMFEQVRSQFLSSQDVNITKVQPSILNVNLDERIERRVPVDLRMDLSLRRQYAMIGEVGITPDSVDITGARSRVEGISLWPTELVVLEEVREPIDMQVALEPPSAVVQVNHANVRVQAQISEFTEGELRVPVTTTGLPAGRNITFTPSSVTVRYAIPIEEYAQSQEDIPFNVYVPYNRIAQDTTGLVSVITEITSPSLNIRLRSTQPRSVSYFVVLEEEE